MYPKPCKQWDKFTISTGFGLLPTVGYDLRGCYFFQPPSRSEKKRKKTMITIGRKKELQMIWVFPKIGVKPPKWMVYKRKPYYRKKDDLGGKPTIFGNTQLSSHGFIDPLCPSPTVLRCVQTPAHTKHFAGAKCARCQLQAGHTWINTCSVNENLEFIRAMEKKATSCLGDLFGMK